MNGKIPEKISYKYLLRENKRLKEVIQKITQREQSNFKTMFIVAIKLRQALPNDDVFTNGMIGEDFLKMIDNEIKRILEMRERDLEKAEAANAEDVPEEITEPVQDAEESTEDDKMSKEKTGDSEPESVP